MERKGERKADIRKDKERERERERGGGRWFGLFGFMAYQLLQVI